jgi:hypothetical protein
LLLAGSVLHKAQSILDIFRLDLSMSVNFDTVIASGSGAIAESKDCCEFLGITVTVKLI